MTFPFLRAIVLAIGIASIGPWAFGADGRAVYEKTCGVCHATGVANAPKLGDKAAWGPRVATGKDALVKSALAGKGAMPAKGGAADLSDDDVKAAIDHMLAAVK